MMTQAKAQKIGDKMLSLMKGKGWVLRVWENLGWHCGLTNRLCGLSVHYSEYRADEKVYWCMMADGDRNMTSFGSQLWTDSKGFDDPNLAVKYQLSRARAVVDFLEIGVKKAEDIYEHNNSNTRRGEPRCRRQR